MLKHGPSQSYPALSLRQLEALTEELDDIRRREEERIAVCLAVGLRAAARAVARWPAPGRTAHPPHCALSTPVARGKEAGND